MIENLKNHEKAVCVALNIDLAKGPWNDKNMYVMEMAYEMDRIACSLAEDSRLAAERFQDFASTCARGWAMGGNPLDYSAMRSVNARQEKFHTLLVQLKGALKALYGDEAVKTYGLTFQKLHTKKKSLPTLPLTLSKDEYLEVTECYGGICLNCTEIKYEGCEPDAENYFCEECGKNRVQGIGNALIDGNIEITE